MPGRPKATARSSTHWLPTDRSSRWDRRTLTHYLHRSGYFKGYIAQEAIEVGQRVLDKLHEPEAPAAASATADSVDLAESLASLSDLHEKGLLTAEEFSRAKAKLLT